MVGLEADLEKAQLYIGRTLRSLNLTAVYNVQVARITRNGFDLPAHANTRLNKGDILNVVGQQQSLENVKKHLGDNLRELYTASVISILAGILIGFLIGRFPIYLPGMGLFTMGTTGGVLAAGMVFGYLKKNGPVIWEIPVTANSFIRELGLMFFLATVGSSAGATILTTLRQFGLPLLAAGILTTLIPLATAFWACHRLLGIPFLRTLGVLTGGMTSTPGLATATTLSPAQYAATAYATVYPMAVIGMILFTKLLIWIL